MGLPASHIATIEFFKCGKTRPKSVYVFIFGTGRRRKMTTRLGVLNEIVGFVMSDCPFGERVACIGVQ